MPIILATDYPPLYVVGLFLLAVLCEIAAVGLSLATLSLCWFKTRTAQAHLCSRLAVIAARAGFILTLVSHKLDLQPELDRENWANIGCLTGPPALVAAAAFAWTHFRYHHFNASRLSE